MQQFRRTLHETQVLFHLTLDVGRSPFVGARVGLDDQVGGDAFHPLVYGEFSGLCGYNFSCVNANGRESFICLKDYFIEVWRSLPRVAGKSDGW